VERQNAGDVLQLSTLHPSHNRHPLCTLHATLVLPTTPCIRACTESLPPSHPPHTRPRVTHTPGCVTSPTEARKVICPVGFYCPGATMKALRCPWLSTCNSEGNAVPGYAWWGVLLIMALLVLMGVALELARRRGQAAQNRRVAEADVQQLIGTLGFKVGHRTGDCGNILHCLLGSGGGGRVLTCLEQTEVLGALDWGRREVQRGRGVSRKGRGSEAKLAACRCLTSTGQERMNHKH
jgi:hypothetical protein